MPRPLHVAAAQLGPIGSDEPRRAVLARAIALLERAAARGVQLVVLPELALTTFFPRHDITDPDVLDRFFETQSPGPATQALFDAARRLGLGLQLGWAERVQEAGHVRRYNSTVLVDTRGDVVGRYRKVHLPGESEPQAGAAFQHLEKRCFEPGKSFTAWRAFGGIVGSLTCNDRRWPEAWRVLGLQEVELVLLGFNTPLHNPEAPSLDRLVRFHHALSMQAGCYQNGTWAVAAAKAGVEEGQPMLADSMIVAPTGEIVAQSQTDGDELVAAEIDLDATAPIKTTIFDFAAHRQPAAYGAIVAQTGSLPPP